MRSHSKESYRVPVVIRRLLLSWLLSVTISYGVLPQQLKELNSLAGIAQMSLPSVLIMIVIFFCAVSVTGLYLGKHYWERWLMVGTFGVLAVLSLLSSFTRTFLIACCLILFILIIYALFGWNGSDIETPRTRKAHPAFGIIVAALATAFALFVSVWTVSRVNSFNTPTYDFGIFSQMFYHMKTSGAPLTTLERDGMLSHFQVHVSPIYYLLLPVYHLFPTPATLQVMQAVILASAVIPLWLVSRKHGLSPTLTTILCALLLVYPAYSGGTSYDIHENAFLTPLILWLLYSLDRKCIPLSIVFSCLILFVKEDAAVYVAVIALYLLTRALLIRSADKRWGVLMGLCMLIGSVIWFAVVTGYLAAFGDGVMTGRYQNFMFDGSGSLLSVIKAVILCPMKVLFESVDQEKLKFIHLSLFPLLGIPLFTRRYERYLLLIPYVLVNLMSDYPYQHDVFFQYTYGATALLFYLTAINLADIKYSRIRLALCITALICGVACFRNTIIPVAEKYPKYCTQYSSYYAQVRETLNKIPEDASVSATTYYTTYLSQRNTLYDVKYTTRKHLLSTEYIALAVNEETSYKQYATDGANGYENLCRILEEEGYELFAQANQILVIYRKVR